MSAQRITDNQNFLYQFLEATSTQRKTIILNASAEEIKSITELLLNVDNVFLHEKELKCVKKAKPFFKKFNAFNKFKSINDIKTFCVSNEKYLKILISCVFSRINQEAIISVIC